MGLWVLYWNSHAYAGSGPGLGSGMLSAVFLLFVSLFTISEVSSDLGWDNDEDFTNCMHLHTYSGVEYRNFHICWEGSWISICWPSKDWESVWKSSTLESCEALKLAQPDLESLVMEHHLKDCRNCLLCSSFLSMLVLRMSKMLKPFWTSSVV